MECDDVEWIYWDYDRYQWQVPVLFLQYSEKVFVCAFVVLCLCCFCFVLSAFICMLWYLYDLFNILLLSLHT